MKFSDILKYFNAEQGYQPDRLGGQTSAHAPVYGKMFAKIIGVNTGEEKRLYKETAEGRRNFTIFFHCQDEVILSLRSCNFLCIFC